MCLVGYGPYAYMCEKYLNLSNSSLILRNPSKPDNLLEEPKGTFYDSEREEKKSCWDQPI